MLSYQNQVPIFWKKPDTFTDEWEIKVKLLPIPPEGTPPIYRISSEVPEDWNKTDNRIIQNYTNFMWMNSGELDVTPRVFLYRFGVQLLEVIQSPQDFDPYAMMHSKLLHIISRTKPDGWLSYSDSHFGDVFHMNDPAEQSAILSCVQTPVEGIGYGLRPLMESTNEIVHVLTGGSGIKFDQFIETL